MTIKSFIQILILILIMFIIGGVYLKYFNTNDKIVEEISLIETNKLDRLKELEKKILDLELKNNKLNSKLSESKENLKINVLDNNKNEGLDIKKKEMGIIKIENENLLNETKKKKSNQQRRDSKFSKRC